MRGLKPRSMLRAQPEKTLRRARSRQAPSPYSTSMEAVSARSLSPCMGRQHEAVEQHHVERAGERQHVDRGRAERGGEPRAATSRQAPRVRPYRVRRLDATLPHSIPQPRR